VGATLYELTSDAIADQIFENLVAHKTATRAAAGAGAGAGAGAAGAGGAGGGGGELDEAADRYGKPPLCVMSTPKKIICQDTFGTNAWKSRTKAVFPRLLELAKGEGIDAVSKNVTF
jgi:hypothetical protein